MMVMLDQRSYPEKPSPLGGGVYYWEFTKFTARFFGVERKHRGLVEAAWMSYVSLLHPSEVAQIHGSPRGLNVKQNPLRQKLLS